MPTAMRRSLVRGALPGVPGTANNRNALPFIAETAMLSLAPVTTMLPVADLARARRFYEDKLGLEPLGAAPDGAFRTATAAPTSRARFAMDRDIRPMNCSSPAASL